MAILSEDDAAHLVGGSATGALGSNASIDLKEDLDAILPTGSQDEAEALLQTHPDYDAASRKWKKYLDLYASNDVYRFIFKHSREVDISWQKRVERGYYYNYVENVIDLYAAFLFHAPIDRKVEPGLSDEFTAIYKDADLSRTLWDVFMARVCTFALVEGHVGVLVDAPASPDGGFRSEADRKEVGARPFLVMVHAHQIRDWETDRHGNFKWVKIEVLRPQERDWKTPAADNVRHFQIWDNTHWEEWRVVEGEEESVAELVKEGDHDLGRVPLVILKIAKDPLHSWFGQSAVKDIADVNIGILNWSSLGDEEIYERCLNILAMERGEGDAPVQLSEHNVLEYDGAHPPQYIVPGETPLKLIMEWINQGKDEIRRLAKLNISTGLGDVRQASSGIAKAFSFLETNQSLAQKVTALEQAETEIHRLIAAWLGDRDLDVTIKYPREFGVEDFLILFQEMDMARSSLTSETAIKEKEKDLLRRMFAKESMELREKMEREVDEADTKMPSIQSAFGMESPFGLKNSGKQNITTAENPDDGLKEDVGQPQPNAGTATAAEKQGG